jgi:hypothetical protein
MMCHRCGYVQVELKRSHGIRTLYEVRTGLPHNCDFGEPKYCKCGSLIYFDNKILSPTGKMIPLNYDEDSYHFCDTWPRARRAEG